MSLRVYNTLTRSLEIFQPLEGNVVKMYVCGPTVYDKAHLGHAMSAIVFDIIRRYLQFKGYHVIHVMNFTDVDDKIIQRANKLGIEVSELSQMHIDEWFEHVRAINVLPAHHYPRVSQVMPQIIDVITALIDNDYAYQLEQDVYYRVRKYEDYGKLSGRSLDDALSGTRIASDERKEDPQDFALWKAAKPEEPCWDSPWGHGRPGWHIECSVMSAIYLGQQIDIHGGGNDLIFPHHENEIAQSEAYSGVKPFARYWLHNGMLNLRGDKMSKSLGNQVSVEEFLKSYEPGVLRAAILSSHYRKPIEFDQEIIDNAQNVLRRLKGALRPPIGSQTEGKEAEILQQETALIRTRFEASMNNDFNTAQAMGHIFAFVRAINTARSAKVGGTASFEAQTVFRELTSILGLELHTNKEQQDQDCIPLINLLLEVRSVLRLKKEWKLADSIRDGLATQGISLEDTPDGTAWHWE